MFVRENLASPAALTYSGDLIFPYLTRYSPLAVKAGVLMSILRTKTRVNTEYVRYLERKIEKSRAGKS